MLKAAVAILSAFAFLGSALAQETAERDASRRCLRAMMQTGNTATAEAAGVRVIAVCDCVGRYVAALGEDRPNNQTQPGDLWRAALQVCFLSAIDESTDRSMRQLQELGRALGLQ
jgi:hypothetical protein